MYGLHCDMCGRFAKLKDVEDWGRIATLTVAYDDTPEPKGEYRHVCPTCLAILMDKFIGEDN